MTSGGKPVQADPPLPFEHLIGLLGGTSVDGVGQVIKGAVRIVDGDHPGALDGFPPQ